MLVENVTLAIVPLFAGEPNRAYACLGPGALVKCVFVVTGLCAASWICHIMYYKVGGHKCQIPDLFLKLLHGHCSQLK